MTPMPANPTHALERVREDIRAFVRESNRIEGIGRTTERHYAAHMRFLESPVTIPALIALVGELQPDARFRNEASVPGVRVGSHVAPSSGPAIETTLRRILAMRAPWDQHVAYETLHPFTDGNGRSGRAIWLHRHFYEPQLDRWAIDRGFLHSFYYHTLSSVRAPASTSGEVIDRAKAVALCQGLAKGMAEGATDDAGWPKSPEGAARHQSLAIAMLLEEMEPASLPPTIDVQAVAKLAAEYRPTMDREVLHSWAADLLSQLTCPVDQGDG